MFTVPACAQRVKRYRLSLDCLDSFTHLNGNVLHYSVFLYFCLLPFANVGFFLSFLR